MKTCPKCNQIFDDDTDFCTNDGTALILDSGQQGFGGFQTSGEMPTQFIPLPQMSAPAAGMNSSNFLYLIIGVLATALAAVGLFALFSGSKPDVSRTTESLSNTLSSPESAPSATVQKNESPPITPAATLARQTDISPRGQWSGNWSTATGAYYTLQVNLDSDGGSELTGQIVWTLRRTTRPDKQSKIGMSATEYVKGQYDPATRLTTLKGYSKNDPVGLLVMVDDYRLNLSADNRRLAGRARNGGKWNGIVDLSR